MSNTTRITCVADSCGTFPMDDALVQKLKRTGQTFTCPAGHEQHFTESTEQKLRERIEELEAEVERYKSKYRNSRESRGTLYDELLAEKDRRKFAESRLLDYATGVIEVADGQYKWSCACDARGQKAFEDVEACQEALDRHQRRSCSLDHDDQEVTVHVEE
ncbi:hypothetical protein [Haloarcula amylovorans]|uniref:hypothetical protein n=1 Tax=Haloarcula amylovorans TaxID=2562280 RepID=UPI00107662D4|nr:hypothetical protein [Halomicroarcula amylolytica]